MQTMPSAITHVAVFIFSLNICLASFVFVQSQLELLTLRKQSQLKT